MTRSAWSRIVGQQRAVTFLRGVVESGRVSHAYLLVGPSGSGKATAARVFASALMCENGGCGTCSACTRVERRVHPDVRTVEPEGAAGYLTEQVREIIHDVQLAPFEGDRKIYIVQSADLFNESSANAFLKTLEEPPPSVVIILTAHSYDAVLPTISSRCNVVRFRSIPPSEAVALLGETGADPVEAAQALAAAGGVVVRARDFLRDPSRIAARDAILRTLKDLATMDELDVLDSAKSLLAAVKAPLERVKVEQEGELARSMEFLARGAVKAMEDRHKRELTRREREGLQEILNIAESWLRDCLVISQGVDDLVINRDHRDAMEEVGAVITPAAVATALRAVRETRRRISYNVSPQLAVEVMLFDVREVLRCPR